MKDLVVVHNLINYSGGIFTVVNNLIKNQISEGIKVYVCYYRHEESEKAMKELEKLGVTLIPVECENRYSGYFAIFGLPVKKVLKTIKSKHPDKKVIIHGHSVASIGLVNYIRRIKAPIVCTIHAKFIPNSKSLALGKLSAKASRNKNITFVGVSNETREYAIKEVEIDPKQVITIYNGIEKVTAEKIATEKTVIGFVGAIVRPKGWNYLLEATKKLREVRDDFEVVFVGDGEDESTLHEKIKEYNLEDTVVCMGAVKRPDINVMPRFDILTLPSESEGLPMVILEAISQGIPVVASNVGGIPEVIKDKENGLLLKDLNSEELYNSLKYLLDNKQQLKTMAKKAEESFVGKFDGNNMAKEYLNLYERVTE
ncbi:glycosyltransferase family 4 protein [Clostridium chauvoei]|uniref:Glycosyltransferase family 4 protein n=2 Tax=Clostridium chauvoei TaxID=46867 RepID=A0ABD4REL8_9CLOT|nr:glycosyltransferase family 4 protein [Clostridium chauvoei]ATD54390.1 hypothetical protein BTM20_03730 [Clostridium chauvoei]ATD57927.1 hypothetical protein BTM21_09330 [Clostridium chauvoei]MBX7279718.1 glycosyltransferase family 4 protein [Clostridium chauvoei]MBX7282087.1 glycosyltransferase family 4 protein [Clostridium chauvoei]MBX7284609.1 glycosyltransferase family 4 protein [Clostridium chauvoei]